LGQQACPGLETRWLARDVTHYHLICRRLSRRPGDLRFLGTGRGLVDDRHVMRSRLNIPPGMWFLLGVTGPIHHPPPHSREEILQAGQVTAVTWRLRTSTYPP
jgi:hypothetical protein